MLVILSGPSGVGKSHLLGTIQDRGLAPTVIPVTTRQRRHDEVEGREYHYLTTTAFQEAILSRDMLFWDYTIGNYYGYTSDIVRSCNSGTVFVAHALARMGVRIRDAFRDRVRLIFLSVDDWDYVRRRLVRRGCGDRELLLRDLHRKEEEVHAPLFDLVVPKAERADSDMLVGLVFSRFS